LPVAGPYFFSWVDPGTAFNPAIHNVMDEYIFSFKRLLKEGDKPTLEMVIRNPHIGLLNPSRKQWAWFSRFNGASIVPIFHGRLIAVPTDVFKELMTIKLVAWPLNYFQQRQAVAEQIKANGPYDPVFIEVEKRDDPDTILEAVSGLWCIDPVTHVVSISDILNGADGNVDINADEHLYDEMSAEFDQTSALTNILMVATVTWNQTGQGYIDMGNRSIKTYAGDALISEWPKPLASLGGGYTVANANAVDTFGVNAMFSGTVSSSYVNTEPEHSDGDQLSANWSVTKPVGGSGPLLGAMLTFHETIGVQNPFASDGNGDTAPINISPSNNATFAYVPLWSVSTSLLLRYGELQRQRTERIQMLLQSDLQAIIVDPQVEQNSEAIVKNGADVGIPIVPLLSWTTIAGQHVDLDIIVFPDNPTLPSQRTAQICVAAGTAGTVEPAFSDVPGVTTTDNTVVWASLGVPNPTETSYNWTAQTSVPLGEVILPIRPLFISWLVLTQGNRQQFPPSPTTVARGTLVQGSNGYFQVCTLGGLTNSPFNFATNSTPVFLEPLWGTTYGQVVHDGSVEWTNIGPTLPDGKTHFMCVQAGQTGAQFMTPSFNNALHARTPDGGVIWSAIGTGDIPAGGTPGDVWARSYFTTARGQNSLEYLISIMRARGRMKARAVTIDFTPIDPFGTGLSMTLRKTVTLTDTRLGGGVATGKLTTIEHACDGNTGHETCHAQIGCAIGKDTVISGRDGNPTYVNGYVQGYRAFTDTVVVLGDNSDVGYTPPIFLPNDDGLVFPLTKEQITISEAVRGSLDSQISAVNSSLNSMAAAARIMQTNTFGAAQVAALLGANSINFATARSPIWYDAVLKPLTDLQFNSYYNVTLTKLTCQRGINLEGSSTP